ncbi:MAG TPA: glycine cleavage system protein GcvH [Actinomycetes bacterium]
MSETYPEDLKYTEEHEWARIEGDRAVVGITHYAQDALGDIVYVDIPPVGTTVTAGETFGEVESTKSVSDIYSPLSGTIAERNEQLDKSPEIINSDPYGEGWLVALTMTDASEADRLMDAGAYRDMVAEQ